MVASRPAAPPFTFANLPTPSFDNLPIPKDKSKKKKQKKDKTQKDKDKKDPSIVGHEEEEDSLGLWTPNNF
jgi:hypothetical protein